MEERQRAFEFTGAEQFWYILHCIWFFAAYFAKVPTKKALSDAGLVEMTQWERFWYVLMCIAFGAGYLAKVPAKKALNEAGLANRTGAEEFWYVLLCIYFGLGYLMKVPMAFGPGTSVAAWVSASRPAAAFAAAAASMSACCPYNCEPQNNCKQLTKSSAPATVQTCSRFIIVSVIYSFLSYGSTGSRDPRH